MIRKARRSFRHQKLIILALGAAIATMAYLGVRLYDQIALLRVSPRDNVQWLLSQLEVDQLILAQAIHLAADGYGTLDEVRLRFDNFYSRLAVVRKGRVYAKIRSSEEVGTAINQLQAKMDELVPLIEGPDDALRDRLLDIYGRVIEFRPIIRVLSLEGVRLFAEETDSRNERFFVLLAGVSLIAIGLILALALIVLFMIRAHRILAERNDEIVRSRKLLAATINGALDAIVVIDDKDRIIEFNEAAEKVFGYPRDMALGAHAGELIVPEEHRRAYEAGIFRFAGGGACKFIDQGRFELSALRSDGTELPIELSISSAVGESGPIYVGYLRDISARLEAEQALTVARDQALAAGRAKSDFIAVISHEMRTPLHGVLGALDLVCQMDLGERQKYLIDIAVCSGEILLRQINEVLDIEQIEAGLTSGKERVELAGVLQEAVRVSGPSAELNGNTLRLSISPDVGQTLVDPHRILQVILNLVANAIKFTENGTIVVEALRPAEGESDQVEISVSDTGIGIAAKDLDRIFDDFVTLDSSYQRRSTGSGLGLAICRRIITAMGGKIGVESKRGIGSRFWVRLPSPPITTLESRGPSGTEEFGRASAHGDVEVGALDVLVVEDNPINRVVVKEMLQRLGHRVAEACDGAEGVRQAELKAFDLIIMDISMPDLDGVDATRQIRAGSGRSQGAVIIGLTAHADPEEHKHFVEAGMQSVVTKPLRTGTLTGVIAAAMSSVETTEAQAKPAAAPDRQWPQLIDSEVISDLALVLRGEIFAKTLAQVSEEIMSVTPEIRAAAGNGELDTAARKAHALAGLAALVGAQRLHRVLCDIEAACMAGRRNRTLALLDGDFTATAEATREALQMALSDLSAVST